MIVRLRHWYLARSDRERRLLLLMALIGLPLLAWLLVILPLDRAYDDALKRHVEAIDRNGRVKMLAATPPGLRTEPLGGDLTLIVTESAAASGIVLDSNTAVGPGAVTIAISSASPGATLQWLRGLEARGLFIDELRLSPAAGGNASATVRLSRGAA